MTAGVVACASRHGPPLGAPLLCGLSERSRKDRPDDRCGRSRASPCLRRHLSDQASTATGIRTRVSAMRGRRPSPLDDSGAISIGTRLAKRPSGSFQAGLIRAHGIEQLIACGYAIFAGSRHADVAELVDAHGSGPCLGNRWRFESSHPHFEKALLSGAFLVDSAAGRSPVCTLFSRENNAQSCAHHWTVGRRTRGPFVPRRRCHET